MLCMESYKFRLKDFILNSEQLRAELELNMVSVEQHAYNGSSGDALQIT